jgi:uncharacterized membrane protein HdeD (DUF308 family)
MTPDASFESGFKKTVRWTLFTAGGVIILVGALGALSRVFSIISPPSALGVGLIFSGLNYLVPYFALKNSKIRPKWLMVLGGVDAIFGILFLTRLGLLPFRLPTLIGLWIIFVACARVYMAFANFRAGVGKWWVTLTVSAYMVLASASMMANSADTASLLAWNALIVTGLFIINEGRKLFEG